MPNPCLINMGPSPPLGCKSPRLKSPPPAAVHKVDDDDDDNDNDDEDDNDMMMKMTMTARNSLTRTTTRSTTEGEDMVVTEEGNGRGGTRVCWNT